MNNILVYPNHFNRYIHIQFSPEYIQNDLNIQLSNLSGQILLQNKINTNDTNFNHNSVSLDFDRLDLIDGLYLLSIENNQIGRQVFKIVKSTK